MKGLLMLAALPWPGTDGGAAALGLGTFGDELQVLSSAFLQQFMYGLTFRPGFIVGFAVAAGVTIRFFAWFRQRVW